VGGAAIRTGGTEGGKRVRNLHLVQKQGGGGQGPIKKKMRVKPNNLHAPRGDCSWWGGATARIKRGTGGDNGRNVLEVTKKPKSSRMSKRLGGGLAS